jgi:hypothetical protein
MIATRLLHLRDGESKIEIPIRIFAPRDRDGSWSCRYEIDWPEGCRTMEALGADSVQAILLAFQMIGAELYTSDHHKSGRLMFHEPGQGYGFPVAASIRDLLIGNDRKYGA